MFSSQRLSAFATAMAALAASCTAATPHIKAGADMTYAPKAETPVKAPAAALEVVDFWKAAGPSKWFAKDGEFDRDFYERFADLHEAAARGELGEWERTAEGVLALAILLDQFPRNAFRGTPRMFATDAMAREIADRAIRSGLDAQIPADLRLFVYIPFGHSESLADQERSVALSSALGANDQKQAMHHRDIIARFGRFPHRNPILGRAMRPEEQEYLDKGGYRG